MLTWLIARKTGGWLSLRIDDIDRARYRAEYVLDILENLEWLGIDYEQGAKSLADFEANFSQHHRLQDYEAALQKLRLEDKLFACTCSRKDISRASSNGIYPRTCRHKNLPFTLPNTAWRLYVESRSVQLKDLFRPDYQVDLSTSAGDFVLKTKNGLPAYQLVSLVEDERDQHNFLVRGEDLIPSTLMQRYLADALQLTHFPKATFLHHPLIQENGRKLSKSAGDLSLGACRKRWESPAKFYRLIAQILNMPDWATIDRLSLLLERFNIEQIPQKAINLADLELE